MLAVFTRYWEEHSDDRANPSAARRAGDLLIDFLGDDAAKVGLLTQDRQREFMRWLRERHGHSVAYISRVQSIVAAALNRAVADDDMDAKALLTRAPKIIVQPSAVAEVLDAPEPMPRTWHPDLKSLAKFFDAIPPEEETRLLRFSILMLALGGRPEAIKQLTPGQIDTRDKLVSLNPDGRRQNKKYRATVPVADRLWPVLETWCEAGTVVHNEGQPVVVLRKPWAAVRKAAGLPAQFTPYALRHMVGSELRRRRVSKEQREAFMGHRRRNTNDLYGQFDPDYLADAKAAIDSFLGELEAACKTPLFRQVSANAALEQRRLKVVK